MLLVQSKTLSGEFAGQARLMVLKYLEDRGFSPLIRAARQHFYNMVLVDNSRGDELERFIVKHTGERTALYESYVRGDLFCFDDYALYLVFDEGENEREAYARVGIVYETGAIEPQLKLDEFGRHVQVALIAARSEQESASRFMGSAETDSAMHTLGLATWKPSRASRTDEGVTQAQTPDATEDANTDSSSAFEPFAQAAIRYENAAKMQAMSLLQKPEARNLLQSLVEAQAEGRVVKRSTNVPDGTNVEHLINELANSGMVRREILISCHSTGRGLFRLPSLEAISALTTNDMRCHECGRPIADERAEELIAPTPFAAKLLGEGLWLTDLARGVLDKFGIDDAHTVAQSSDEGIAFMLVKFYGETFLLLLREGDWTTAHTARALELAAQMHAAHVVATMTGGISTEARVLLRDAAQRRVQKSGEPLEAIICEGLDSFADTLESSFERVVQRAIYDELCALDASLGFSIGHMIAMRFQLHRRGRSMFDDFAMTAHMLSANLNDLEETTRNVLV